MGSGRGACRVAVRPRVVDPRPAVDAAVVRAVVVQSVTEVEGVVPATGIGIEAVHPNSPVKSW